MKLSNKQKQALIWANKDCELLITGLDARPVNIKTIDSLIKKGLLEYSGKYQIFTSVYNQQPTYKLTEKGKEIIKNEN